MPSPKIPPISSGRKQALVINASLGMKSGKIAAQCCHAVQACDKRVIFKATAEGIEELERKARRTEGCIVIRIIDAGKTQVEPGSLTVLSLTGMEPIVNELTKGMRLL